jgi:exonuclease III
MIIQVGAAALHTASVLSLKHTHSMAVTKLASINVNTLHLGTRVDMLFDFIRQHDIDLTMIQEVSDTSTIDNRGYNIHHNIGTNRRGTAFVTTQACQLTNVARAPDGRATAATLDGTRIMSTRLPAR